MFLELGIRKEWFLHWFGFHETYFGKGLFFIFLACLGVVLMDRFTFSFIGKDGSQVVSFGFPGFLLVWGIILLFLHCCCARHAHYKLVR